MEVEKPLWRGTQMKAEEIKMLVSVLLYHVGQIALLWGAFRRMKQN